MTHSRRDVVALMESHGLHPSRALGQNFVVDPNTVRRIARLANIGPQSHVIEIGPGLGSLTMALAETGARIDAVEIDRFLLAPLRSVVEPLGVVVHHGDALTFDFSTIIDQTGAVVVANLPYNVATPLVLHLLESFPLITRMLVMVQREVGERFAAFAGDEAYGAVSLRVQYYAQARVVGKVPASVFVPRPKVESALVLFERRPRVAVDPSLVSEAALFEVVRTAFGQRRKMLRRSLSNWSSEGVFERAGIDETRRPEELTLEEFARLAQAR